MLNFQELGTSIAEAGEEGGSHSSVSINLVGEFSMLFQYMFEDHGPLWYIFTHWDHWYDTEVIYETIQCASQLVNTLTEVQQGPCFINQVELARGRFIESVNWFLDALNVAETHTRDEQYGHWNSIPVELSS